MSKYSNEFKLQVIKYYIEEHHSYSEGFKNLFDRWQDRYRIAITRIRLKRKFMKNKIQ